MRTPWGNSDYEKDYGNRDIVFYGTPSHGGFKVCKKLNDKMPDYMRNADGWYEEDCEWSKVVVFFPEYFREPGYDGANVYETALDSFKNWCPDAYEKLFGKTLKPGESYMKDRRKEAANG